MFITFYHYGFCVDIQLVIPLVFSVLLCFIYCWESVLVELSVSRVCVTYFFIGGLVPLSFSIIDKDGCVPTLPILGSLSRKIKKKKEVLKSWKFQKEANLSILVVLAKIVSCCYCGRDLCLVFLWFLCDLCVLVLDICFLTLEEVSKVENITKRVVFLSLVFLAECSCCCCYVCWCWR